MVLELIFIWITQGLRGILGWDFIRITCPSAQINQLAAFRTKWTKVIALPCGGITAAWAMELSWHNVSLTSAID